MIMEHEMRKKAYFKDRFEKGAQGISAGIFVSLGVGMLLKSLGGLLHFDLLVLFGTISMLILAPALGGAIAYSLGANGITLVSAMVAATIGGNALKEVNGAFTIQTGLPIGAIIGAIVATYVGKKVTGKTILDMMAVPTSAVLAGSLAGYYLARVVEPALVVISKSIAQSVEGQPLISSVVIALVFAVIVMTPASSAALVIVLQLDPASSAAALVGISAQFVGYTAMGLKDNDLGGFLAQLVCTPKVQFPNIVNNPKIMVAPLAAAAISGPVAILGFHLGVPYEIGGIGLCGFIAPLQILNDQGVVPFTQFMIAGVLLPLVVTYVLHYGVARRFNHVKAGDLALEIK
ncbi:hypothetical protein BHU61_11600 [Macrococcus epidermidis]|uniref:Phosphotransferase system EIIC domain-containing protein n=2 Tax=Macrococcus epidermidis TaxID=1902580 RepID=A0A327ZN40_9STAP|nr:hypothetical protein BHU61_11600 [Macrococcus epidermidis]